LGASSERPQIRIRHEFPEHDINVIASDVVSGAPIQTPMRIEGHGVA
jgi:hypothetical protein